jgi:hypothetical protein
VLPPARQHHGCACNCEPQSSYAYCRRRGRPVARARLVKSRFQVQELEALGSSQNIYINCHFTKGLSTAFRYPTQYQVSLLFYVFAHCGPVDVHWSCKVGLCQTRLVLCRLRCWRAGAGRRSGDESVCTIPDFPSRLEIYGHHS